MPEILDEIQQNLFARALAFREAHTYKAETFEEMERIFSEKTGFVEAYFAGTREDEKMIKEKLGIPVRCFPLERKEERGKCFYTGKEGARLALFAKSY